MPDMLPLGIFGGTFDPVHIGHLRLAEEAREQLGLSRVRWIPAGQPRHRATPCAEAGQRLRMVELAVADNPYFVVDAAEVASNQASYTVPTLLRLRDELGSRQPLVLLLGADAYAGLTGWHRWQEIFDLAHLAIAQRPGYPLDAATLPDGLREAHLARVQGDPAVLKALPAGRILGFTMTPLAVSATQVRSLFMQGCSARYLLPAAVIDHIHSQQLYRPHDGS